jgi:HK97 family phage prohead protease
MSDPRPALPAVVTGRRDHATTLLRRHGVFQPRWRDAEAGKPRQLTALASTSDPVDWGWAREVLVHAPGAVDWKAARALLVNHDPNQIAGTLANLRLTPEGLETDATLLAGATMASGVTVEAAIEAGALRGISIGYNYLPEDTTWDEDTRTLTVRKWRVLEVSLTPIPADDEASLRSRSAHGEAMTRHHHTRATAPISGKNMPTFSEWLAARGLNPTTITAEQRAVLEADYAAAKGRAAAAADADEEDAADGAAEEDAEDGADAEADTERAAASSERARAEAMREQRAIAKQAKSLGLEPDEFVGLTRAAAKNAMLKALTVRNATAKPIAPVVGAPATVDYDQLDKATDAFTGALAHRAGVRSAELDKHKVNNPMLGGGLQHAIREYCAMMGVDTRGWTNKDIAGYALGRPELMSTRSQRAGANVGVGQFGSFVFLNAITKIVAKGFEFGSQSARYRPLVQEQVVPDFKQFSIGSLSVGNLIKTAELMVFPELDKAEGVYNSTALMWGGTLSLSIQALVSDDTAQFDRLLRMAGAIADKTIDRRVFQKLLMGTSTAENTSTWTNNTTSGGSLVYTTADLGAAARGKLAIVRAALMNKAGKDTNPYGNIPRYLVVGPTREVEAQAIVGGSGPALQAGEAQVATRTMDVVATPWLEATALTGNSTTSYYLLADPNEVTALVVSKVRGFENIQVTPYDAGAVAGFNWKLWLPFEADLVSDTVSGTKYFPGAQQGTT